MTVRFGGLGPLGAVYSSATVKGRHFREYEFDPFGNVFICKAKQWQFFYRMHPPEFLFVWID